MIVEERGILFIEGAIGESLRDGASVRPLAEILKQACSAPILFRQAHTLPELVFHLGRARTPTWECVFIAVHGRPGELEFEDWISFDELAEAVGQRLQSRILHLSSCCALADAKACKRFVKATGLRWLSGYAADVGWAEVSAIEILYLELLAWGWSLPRIERKLQERCVGLLKEVGWRIVRP